MADLHWATLRDQAIKAFNGELPNATTEQDLIDAFTTNPLAVTKTLNDVAEQHANGKTRSGWAVWRSRTLAVHNATNITVQIEDDRETKIAKAEAWIRNAGLHYDRETEIEDELFGDLGLLRNWAADEQLRQRILNLWRQKRPAGEQTEREQIERAEKWKATRAAVEAAQRKGPPL